LVVTVSDPKNITILAFFLNTALPDGLGGALYYSIPPYETLQFIGAVGNARPSDIFHTGFALNPYVNELNELKLVIKVEPLENLKDLVLLNNNNEIQKEFAKKVALNLYNFMVSFNKIEMLPNGLAGEYLVIPSNFIDKWIAKFEEKYKHDPNFIVKTE